MRYYWRDHRHDGGTQLYEFSQNDFVRDMNSGAYKIVIADEEKMIYE